MCYPSLQLPHPPQDGHLHLQDIRLADGLLDGLEVLLQESSGCWQCHVLHLLGRNPEVSRISISNSGETNILREYLDTMGEISSNLYGASMRDINFNFFTRHLLVTIINRPGVAGAVLQSPPSLIN